MKKILSKHLILGLCMFIITTVLVTTNLTKYQIANAQTDLNNNCNGALPVPSIKQNMPYAQARKMLIDAGWQTTWTHLRWPSPNTFVQTIFDYGWTEVDDCSGTGLGLCRFIFQDAARRSLVVSTSSNIYDDSGKLESKVFGWFFEE